tara:strand:- start:5 stop:664 length:660 start_codon:yes stop_codon:yes gene_type:complete
MVKSLKIEDLESLFDPDREDRYKGKSVKWFKEYGSKMAESTAFRTDTDCRGLVATVIELHKDDYWKKINPNWNDFCLEVFKKPAKWVDVIVEGVRTLHLKDPKVVEKPIPQKVIPLVKKGEIGNGRNKSRSYLVTPTRGNSREYLYRKIARDFPEVIENDEIGEDKKYETPYMAAKALGIVKRSPSLELKAVENVAKKIKEKMGKNYAIKLSKELMKND